MTFGVFSPAKGVHEGVFKVQNGVFSCHLRACGELGAVVWLGFDCLGRKHPSGVLFNNYCKMYGPEIVPVTVLEEVVMVNVPVVVPCPSESGDDRLRVTEPAVIHSSELFIAT